MYICIVNKKESIISSALQLLTEKGVHNTPMSAIAKASGTGMGTIYNYFPNKDALINDIYTKIKNEEKEVFLNFESGNPIKTQFENYFTSVIAFFVQNPSYFQFMEQLQASPIITAESKEVGKIAIAQVVELLEKGKQDRIIKDIEVEELLMFIGGAILSYLRYYFNQSQNTSPNHQMKMVWDAIKE